MGAQRALRGRSTEHELLARLLENVRDGQSAVLVIRGESLVTGDATLDDADEIEIRPVISGG